MPPPVSYIDITSIPFSRTVTVAEFNVANVIWFRYVTAIDTILGGNKTYPGFTLTTEIYESDGTTLIENIGGAVTGWWQQLAAGTYYIRLDNEPPGPISTDILTNFNTALLNTGTVVPGSYLISDDKSTQLAANLRQNDGTLIGFYDVTPTGETATALPTGISLWHDRYAKYAAKSVILIGSDLTHISTITPAAPQIEGWPFVTEDGTDFYVINSSSTGGTNFGVVWKVTSAGVLTNTGIVLPFTGAGYATAVGISRDATTFYWAEYDSPNIKKYVGGVASILYTVPGYSIPESDRIALNSNLNPGEIIVLPDGTLVTWWFDWSIQTDFILHLTSGGVLLNSINCGANVVNHLATISETDSTKIGVWFFNGLSTIGTFVHLNLTTEVMSPTFTIVMFQEGANMESGDLEMFGPCMSCPFIVLLSGSTPVVPPNHIFRLTPGLRTDDSERIPTPYFISSLLGD